MCGITGVITTKEASESYFDAIKSATYALQHRGPDSYGSFSDLNVLLGQTRLSIIDTSHASDQPFYSSDGRYVIVYNGEIFNFNELKNELIRNGVSFETTGDTEVLLQLYINEGSDFLNRINGFFAFAIYDNVKKILFVARDRFGIKPLFYYSDSEKFIFSSEIKSLLRYPIERRIDYASLLAYLQLNYVPAPDTMLEGVKKFPIGNFAIISASDRKLNFTAYYTDPYISGNDYQGISYDEAVKTFYNLLEDSVKRRLIADVPLGTFLSGGLDSSAITAIAALHKPNISSFSIGYKDEPMFDETKYSSMVSKKLGTNHHVFKLDNSDLFNELYNILDTHGEPFGDSSCIPVYILSKKVRQSVKVALSGDGADELMGGYNKHKAELTFMQPGYLKKVSTTASPLLKLLPHSRNNPAGNKVRQALRFAEGVKLNSQDRYWAWASIARFEEAIKLLKNKDETVAATEKQRKSAYLSYLNDDFNSVLFTDLKLVLQNDMLVKTDLMSMANSLEVRVPFLDHNLVQFLFSLPVDFKIHGTVQKRILRDAVGHLLPMDIITRKKQGFEVPLLKWFKTELKGSIESIWLDDDYIEEQSIFDPHEVKELKKKLYSVNPGDSVARIWGLIVFQHWYKRNCE